jgi:hypothetical protein
MAGSAPMMVKEVQEEIRIGLGKTCELIRSGHSGRALRSVDARVSAGSTNSSKPMRRSSSNRSDTRYGSCTGYLDQTKRAVAGTTSQIGAVSVPALGRITRHDRVQPEADLAPRLW